MGTLSIVIVGADGCSTAPQTNPRTTSTNQQVLLELYGKKKEQRANPLLRTRDGDSPWLVAGQWSHLRDAMGRDQRALFEAMQKRVVRIVAWRVVSCAPL